MKERIRYKSTRGRSLNYSNAWSDYKEAERRSHPSQHDDLFYFRLRSLSNFLFTDPNRWHFYRLPLPHEERRGLTPLLHEETSRAGPPPVRRDQGDWTCSNSGLSLFNFFLCLHHRIVILGPLFIPNIGLTLINSLRFNVLSLIYYISTHFR